MVEAVGEECGCFLAVNLETEELVTLIAESTASSLASVCVGAPLPPACTPLPAIHMVEIDHLCYSVRRFMPFQWLFLWAVAPTVHT